MFSYFFTAFYFLLLGFTICNEDCNYQKSCDDCIKASYRCNWCADGDFDVVKYPTGRCSDSPDRCPNPMYNLHVNSKLEGALNSDTITINLRADESFTFHVEVAAEPELPYQMYYLFDGSRSMASTLPSVKENVKKLAIDVISKWKNSKVGLGLFGDKETMPFGFMNITYDGVKSTVIPPDYNQEKPFWLMAISLTDKTNDFDAKVDGITLVNFTDPDNDGEAQIDVLSQVMSCKATLKFEEKSDTRHLVFLTTDSPFWAAGDGKFAGIVSPTPNGADGKGVCRGTTTLDQSGKSVLYDYPSAGFIKNQLQNTGSYLVTSVILDEAEGTTIGARSFANINQMVYDSLQKLGAGLIEYIPNRVKSAVGNALNVDETMKKLDAISRRVSLVASGEDVSNYIISYDVTCPDSLGVIPLKSSTDTSKTIACNMMPSDPNVKANITVTVRRKPGAIEQEKDEQFLLNLPGVHPKKPLRTVNIKKLDPKCNANECNAADSANKDKNQCGNHGTLNCGVCDCDPSWHGSVCDCAESDKNKVDLDQCRVTADPTTPICDGNGDCWCGECECKSNSFGNAFVGSKCQCDPDSCPKDGDGETCYGHGSCICDEVSSRVRCECENSWDPERNCQCTLEDVCKDEDSEFESVCNDRGKCSCDGDCECNNKFTGDFCETCDNAQCLVALCAEDRYAELVKCTLKKNCDSEFDREFNSSLVAASASFNSAEWKKCTNVDTREGCSAEFYVFVKDIFTVVVPDNEVCAEGINPIIIIIVVACLVIFLGALFIAGYKIYIEIQARMEFQAWEKADKERNQQSNPLYANAEKKYANPNYNPQG